jgi:hypothetical protein
MNKPTKFRKGDHVVLTEGEYADFCICAIAVVVKDFDSSVIRKLLKDNWEGILTKFHHLPFWLIEQGYIKKLEYSEVCTVNAFDGLEIQGMDGEIECIRDIGNMKDS